MGVPHFGFSRCSSTLQFKRQDFLVVFPADDIQVLQWAYSKTSMFVSGHVCLYVQNQLVDVCEKIQLQALRIEKFINHTLAAKEQKLQVRNHTHSAAH